MRLDSISFDRIADRYDETRGGMDRARNIAAGLDPHLVRGTVLEIGVGTGAIATALTDLGRQVVGVDLSEPMLRVAIGRLGQRVSLGDGHRLPVRTGGCSNVILGWVLHLVGDPSAVLAEARRVLRPGGRVVAVQRPTQVELDDIDTITEAMNVALRAGRPDPARVPEQAAAAGLTLVERSMTPARTFQESPAEAVSKIEQRTFSSLWDVDDATWTSIVQPAVAALRALPSPESRRPRSVSQDVFVFAADPAG